MSARLGALLCVLAVASPAVAQPVSVRETAIAEASAIVEARLVAGDTLAAYRAAGDLLERIPDAVPLAEARLRIQRAGYGFRRFPPPVRRRRTVRTARNLLDLDATNALALQTLADDAIADVLFFRDRGPRFRSGGSVTRAEANVRLRGSRFDISQRAAIRPLLDRSGAGRDAAEAASGYLDALPPATAAPLAVVLAVADQDWARLGDAAVRLRPHEPAQAALYGAVAAWRLGRTEPAGRRLAEALAGIPTADRDRLLDLTPLLSPDSLAAYRADPVGFSARFWQREDPRRITPAPERKVEHVARVIEADALFGRTLGDLFSDRPRRGAQTDRGRIWVRYGRPSRETGFTQDAAVPTYDRDGVAAYVVWEYDRLDGGTRFVFDDPTRMGTYNTYSPPASAFATSRGRAAVDDYIALDDLLQRTLPQAYIDTLASALPLVTARFRAQGGATEVVVAFPVSSGARAAVFVRDARLDARRGATTIRLDSAATIRAETLAGEGFASADVALGPLARSGFGISDVLIVGGDGPAVERLGERLAPLLSDTLSRAVIRVYAEAYGLALRDGRTRADTEARLVPVDTRGGVRRFADRLFGRSRRRGVSVAAEIEGASPTEALGVGLDASGLPPGPYRLVLTVTDRVSGQSASTERVVTLR